MATSFSRIVNKRTVTNMLIAYSNIALILILMSAFHTLSVNVRCGRTNGTFQGKLLGIFYLTASLTNISQFLGKLTSKHRLWQWQCYFVSSHWFIKWIEFTL